MFRSANLTAAAVTRGGLYISDTVALYLLRTAREFSVVLPSLWEYVQELTADTDAPPVIVELHAQVFTATLARGADGDLNSRVIEPPL